MNDILMIIFVVGNIASLIWIFIDYANSGEDNIFKATKYITWGRLLFCMIFFFGFIFFYCLGILFWVIIKIYEFFEEKRPLAFLGKRIFK